MGNMFSDQLDLGYHGAVCFLHTWLLSSTKKKEKKENQAGDTIKFQVKWLSFCFVF